MTTTPILPRAPGPMARPISGPRPGPGAGPGAGPGPIPARQGLNTLQVFKASRAAIMVLVVLLMGAIMAGTTVHRDAMKTVGKDAAPSIIAAQHIKSALADMDAEAANELLEPGSSDTATQAFERRRTEADDAVIAAAENITFGKSEREPIEALVIGIGTYERLVQKARDLHASGSAGEVAAYRDAAQLMDQGLLPAADLLDQANSEVLERTYKGQSSKSLAARAFIIVAGLLVLLALAITQGFLSHKTQRTLNPLLLVATILALALTVYSLAVMGDEQHELKVAKEDAFSSIRGLWRARAVAYQANGEESRYLLDKADAAEDQRIFAAESNSLATLPASVTLDQLLQSEADGHKVDGFTGNLADEFNNITFPGERKAALATLKDFEAYEKIDGDVRRLEQSGQHKRAVELCIGSSPGQSNWAFARFDNALGNTLDLNQKAFDASVDKGLSGLSGLELKTAVVAVLIAVLVFLGMAARIREYE